ncbi:MAG TPA: cytochrome c [Candidatus Dormibacteraeota bacterium]|jgi:mono/diheme cytochrome c family protein|nr:cytochrome c [Candidatus Dormibacteraeota bacterium]
MTKLFLGLAAFVLLLIGVAAAKDAHDHGYLSVQEQYLKDYPSSAKLIDVKTQQLFPSFPQAKQGDTFRVERCISCHVPDIATIGPQEAAKRLAQDFFKYDPNAKQIADANHLTGVHPSVVTQQYYDTYGQSAVATKDGFHPYVASAPASSGAAAGAAGTSANTPTGITGFLPSFLSPAQNNGSPLGIDQTGCIVCHNGGRLSLDQTNAHLNLIVNPEYAWTEGAALYYQYCASCHGNLGEGKIGPPLSNQDRLGFFNEDYYYRCIEYGMTDFEHIGSVMPNWGSIAPDYTADKTVDKVPAQKTRQLSEDQINLLVQFIRHWENYQTLP